MSWPAPKVMPPPLPKNKTSTSNKMIEIKFIEGFDLSKTKIIELKSYQDFFNFYQENHDKGCIYDVKII